MKQYTLTIEKPAKSMGGDRYVMGTGKSIYVPQELSRASGTVRENLVLHLATENDCGPETASVSTFNEFTLLRKASSGGDDRYTPGPTNVTWNGDIYLPREMLSQRMYVMIESVH